MRLRRSTLTAIACALVALGAVAFFVVTSLQADALLHDGTRLNATVVRTIPANSWSFFDSGRNVVRYTFGGREYTEAIWLDDSNNVRSPGATWTVVVDRHDASKARSLTDDNSPVPVGFWVALVGLLAVLVAILVAIYRFITRDGRSWSDWWNTYIDRDGLTKGQEVVGILIVLAVDGTLAVAAMMIGWSWLFKYGQLLLLAPTLVTFQLWRWRCSNRRARNAESRTLDNAGHVSLKKLDRAP